MPNGERLWRTAEGDLVPDGHPDALLLAYGVDDEMAAADIDNVREVADDENDLPESDEDDAEKVAPANEPEKAEVAATAKPTTRARRK